MTTTYTAQITSAPPGGPWQAVVEALRRRLEETLNSNAQMRDGVQTLTDERDFARAQMEYWQDRSDQYRDERDALEQAYQVARGVYNNLQTSANSLTEQLVEALREVEVHKKELDDLQNLMDTRPAINAGLPQTYVDWTHKVYVAEFHRHLGRSGLVTVPPKGIDLS